MAFITEICLGICLIKNSVQMVKRWKLQFQLQLISRSWVCPHVRLHWHSGGYTYTLTWVFKLIGVWFHLHLHSSLFQNKTCNPAAPQFKLFFGGILVLEKGVLNGQKFGFMCAFSCPYCDKLQSKRCRPGAFQKRKISPKRKFQDGCPANIRGHWKPIMSDWTSMTRRRGRPWP